MYNNLLVWHRSAKLRFIHVFCDTIKKIILKINYCQVQGEYLGIPMFLF